MSWLRTAVNKAVEVGNKNNLTRNFRNYADTVVHHAGQAVAEGAKLLQDRIASRNVRSVKQTVKRLEEAAISCRGSERVMLLRSWLIALREIEKLASSSSEGSQKSLGQILASEDERENPKRTSMVLYYDSDIGGAPMDFREVFLQSQALEGITVSMIIEAPNDEEISLLLEMFGLCLTGGKEIHNAIVSSIQDLATAFSSYQDEVLVKREELLQFAQSAITGLKIRADLVRMESEASDLKKKLDQMSSLLKLPKGSHDNASETTTEATIEDLKVALAEIRIHSTLEGILQKKKLAVNNGDSPEIHAQKVDKLKVLSESLANSSIKAEKRISDHRLQKEEALTVRVVKANEADEREKETVAEISELEKQRDQLEAELKKVRISLVAANARLHNVREERDHFYEANDQIVAHLKTKVEDELSKSISACKVEAKVLHTWINFLEDTWLLQSSYVETKNKQVVEELERHEDYFVNFAITLLSAYKKELGPSISRISKFVENLKKLSESARNDDSKESNPRKHLEEEYLGYETKIITIFSVVGNLREHFNAKHGTTSRFLSQSSRLLYRKDDPKVKELFDDIEKLRVEFETIERPILEMETPKVDSPDERPQEILSPRPTLESTQPKLDTKENPKTQPKPDTKENPETQPVLDAAAELAKLESEFGKVNQDYTSEEMGDWEFDELEREFISGDSASGK
ncbi:centromere-associated protein E-like [Gossypium australe]|uniref:Centromere-associated protein E-like n=1 Tax=Gossypium australe TaxID=47621 RepID=A0A5B6V546_9ROSI|nr:centromere-associated protein E-like [Gossypium australe]